MAKEIFHECRSAGRTFTREEWGKYCEESHRDPSKLIVTQIGKYDFNDCDMCLNPDTMTGERFSVPCLTREQIKATTLPPTNNGQQAITISLW